jgi:hypothetical protein
MELIGWHTRTIGAIGLFSYLRPSSSLLAKGAMHCLAVIRHRAQSTAVRNVELGEFATRITTVQPGRVARFRPTQDRAATTQALG